MHWYGIAYVAGFIGAALVARALIRRWELPLTDDDLIEVVLAAVIGLVVGARLGYVLVYGGAEYLHNPLNVVKVWDGGMSFHGGLVGILLAGWYMSRRTGVSFLRLADMGAVGAPLGLLFGRLANFINGELWGRVTSLPWGIIFPDGGPLPRHPSQLYEAALEGLVMFVVMFALSRRRRPDGFQLGWFLILYGAFRILVEFARQPDAQIGYLLGAFTIGQLLSLPVLAAGVWLLARARRSAMPSGR